MAILRTRFVTVGSPLKTLGVTTEESIHPDTWQECSPQFVYPGHRMDRGIAALKIDPYPQGAESLTYSPS